MTIIKTNRMKHSFEALLGAFIILCTAFFVHRLPATQNNILILQKAGKETVVKNPAEAAVPKNISITSTEIIPAAKLRQKNLLMPEQKKTNKP